MEVLEDPEEHWGGCGPGNWGGTGRWRRAQGARRDSETLGQKRTGRLQGKQEDGVVLGGPGEREGSEEVQQHQVGTKDAGRELGDKRHCPALTAPLPTGSASTLRCPKTWWAHTRLGHTAWSPCP